MKRHCRLIISVVTMALIFTFSFAPVSYAASAQQFNAFVASALTALNIFGNSISMGIANYERFVYDFISAPSRFVANQFVEVPYTTPLDELDQYLARSVLKIDKDKVTIDGVEYTDIWLSTDAAEQFRVNAFDIENAWDIASHSEGTFVSGEGVIHKVPIYYNGTTYMSPVYSGLNGSYRIGDYDLTRSVRADGTNFHRYEALSYLNGTRLGFTTGTAPGNVLEATRAAFQISGNTPTSLKWMTNHYIDGEPTSSFSADLQGFDPTPFEFDWVAGEIPLDEPLIDEGLRIRVPTSEIDDWYEDYPDTGTNVTFDMGDPTLENKIDDLIDLIVPLIPILDIDFVDYEIPPQPEPIPEPEPYPDPDPQPGTVIPDLDWTDLFNTIKNIFNKISEQVSITTAIKNLLDKIKWFLDDFLEVFVDILKELPDVFEVHIIGTIRSALTGLKAIFLPIFALLRNALGIWHYVVEWFQAISGPFTFYLTTIGQGYPAITIPIYASIAGVIVIAVYRRFGR